MSSALSRFFDISSRPDTDEIARLKADLRAEADRRINEAHRDGAQTRDAITRIADEALVYPGFPPPPPPPPPLYVPVRAAAARTHPKVKKKHRCVARRIKKHKRCQRRQVPGTDLCPKHLQRRASGAVVIDHSTGTTI